MYWTLAILFCMGVVACFLKEMIDRRRREVRRYMQARVTVAVKIPLKVLAEFEKEKVEK